MFSITPTHIFQGIHQDDLLIAFICLSWYISTALKHNFCKEFLTLAPLPVTSSFLECFFTVVFTYGTILLKDRFWKDRNGSGDSVKTEIVESLEVRRCRCGRREFEDVEVCEVCLEGTLKSGEVDSKSNSTSSGRSRNHGNGISEFQEKNLSWKGFMGYFWVILPICISTVLGHTLTQISLEFIEVSFTNTVKALSPIFTMLLSYLMLRQQFSWNMMLSVVPIIFGVFLSSAVELNFNIVGMLAALLSSICFCYVNIRSKLVVESKVLDEYHVLMYTNFGSTALLFILAFATEWSSLADFTNAHQVVLPSHAYLLIVGFGLFHFFQCITAVSFLAKVSPLSYSIANTFKRVFVIVLSIIYFGNKVSLLNYLGILLSVTGILLYNKATSLQKATISDLSINEKKADCSV